MILILNAAVLAGWITSLVAFVRSYRRHLKKERAQAIEAVRKDEHSL
ncbi:hypothetical protein [Planococcus versutus]|nr:hypothetical protein [Planococcus versutus]